MEENRNWTGKWIWPEGGEADSPSGRQSRALFRRVFRVEDANGARLAFKVSADSRYRLYVNGTLAARGPCKGDSWSHYYDEVDATALLKPGDNVVAAEVVHFPIAVEGRAGAEKGPVSVWRSPYGGFMAEGDLIDGRGNVLETIDTGEDWLMFAVDPKAVIVREEKETLFVGGTEIADGALVPDGWREAGYDDSAWRRPAYPTDALDRMYGGLSPWQLAPRPIPPLKENLREFARVARSEWPGASGREEWKLEAGASGWIELDAGRMTTGYPLLECVGGAGAEIRMLYSEAYEYGHREGEASRRAVRDDPEGKELLGNEDIYRPAGTGTESRRETYEPIGRRAFRFVRLAAAAGDAPVTVRVRYLESSFPMETLSRVDTSDADTSRMWEVSLNTLRNCMQDTYEDTPYYEQLQYIMDAKLQALFTYAVSADDRLPRKAIYDFHSSLAPSGMLQSRYPSVSRQIIPGFSLLWIDMVYDHYVHFGDESLVRRYLSTSDAVLGWFERRIGEDGLSGDVPEAYWSFVDWVDEWRVTAGAPPAKRKGPTTVYNLMYAYALDRAAVLNEAAGRADTAAEYRRRAESTREAVRRRCWDEAAGMFRDGPEVAEFSEHVQAWAALSGALPPEGAALALERALTGEGVARASFSSSHFLFRALSKTGLYGLTERLWKPWKEQLDLGLTAWVEDPVQQRSDCHGWSALPLYEYVSETLGVKPGAPGYREILVEPRPAGLKFAKGEAATVQGSVGVEWLAEDGSFTLTVHAPAGIPVVARLPDGSEFRESDLSKPKSWKCAFPG